MRSTVKAFFAAWAVGATALAVDRSQKRQDDSRFVGYLVSTFSDPNPHVQQYLSEGPDPLNFKPLNGGEAILTSTVGNRGVRDIFLTTNSARSEYFVIATDLDINAPGFNWDWATRKGSQSLVIWNSTNLVDWDGPFLRTIEKPTAGMAWAPSVVWDQDEQQYHVFWASRHYSTCDPDHEGVASLDRIRHATTRDFITFSEPSDYYAPPGTPVIDQEFLALDAPGAYARFIKNETVNQMYQELTTDGIFGTWTRVPGYVRPETPLEGAAAYEDIRKPGTYYLWLDNYTEYVPFQTSDIQNPEWVAADSSKLPRGLKHGCVTPVTQKEYDAIAARYA